MPVDEFQVRIKNIATIENTTFYFRTSKTLGKHIEGDDHQLKLESSYDHYLFIKNQYTVKDKLPQHVMKRVVE